MATHANHVAIAAPRNGTTSHTVTPSSGTAVAGTLFTPTAGRLLVCLVEGAVTSTTPAGWTLPANGSAVLDSGLYVWHRTAAGADSLTTTHNGSNYPVVFHFVEFPAGSTFGTAASATGVSAAGGAGPSLSGLSGGPWVAAAMGQDIAGSAASVTWSAGTELADTSTAYASGTDGYTYSLTHTANYGSATWSAAATSTDSKTEERLVFSVAVATGGGTAHPLAGTTTATATATGTLRSRLALVGAAAGVTAAVGAPVGVHPMAGALASSSATSGAPVAVHPLAGALAATSATIGALAARYPLAGTAAGVAATSGTINLVGGPQSHALAGVLPATATTTGTLRSRLALVGAAAGVATVTGTLGTAGAGGRPKVWTGAAWQAKPAKVWTGSAWVEKPVKAWTGSQWKAVAS